MQNDDRHQTEQRHRELDPPESFGSRIAWAVAAAGIGVAVLFFAAA